MKNLLFKLLGLSLLILSLGAGWGWMRYETFLSTPLAVDETGYALNVSPGTSFRAVVDQLAQDGVVEEPLFLYWKGRLEGVGSRFKAGEYMIRPGTLPNDLFQQLLEGKVRQHSLTIVEGWTFRQLLGVLGKNPALRHQLTGLSEQQIMVRLGMPAGEAPEGRFLPDTYYFPKGTTDVAFLKRAYQAMKERLAFEWENRSPQLPLKSPYEALILASIVEKETGVPSERPIIAGVFIRRLQKGMKLQTDPTVIYALGLGFDGNIRRSDLSVDSPYNTYRHRGLPPTPIALPGTEAIRAAVRPAPGNSLFFVAKGDGSHQFSATLADHNRAVTQFQVRRKAVSQH